MATATVTKTTPSNGKSTARATVSIDTVSPRTAEKYLDENTTNRKLRSHRVLYYMGILERGEWKLSGDALVFDENGFLLNGQHRLSAVAEAKIAADFLVLRGVPAETMDVMDRGLQRSLADSLKLRGHVNVFNLASSLNWFYRLSYIETTQNVHYATPGDRPTTAQALKILQRNKDLPDYIRMVQKVRMEVRVRHGLTATLWSTFAGLSQDDAAVFFEQLETGIGFAFGKQDPIYHLRRLLIADMQGVSRMPDYREAALMCKAWNYWRDGKQINQLIWKFGGNQREDFPLPY